MMKILSHVTFFAIFTSILCLSSLPVVASTVEDIIDRDELICGVRGGLSGFGQVDDKGQWTGLDADLCRALASAVLKDKSKVYFLPLTTNARFKALQDEDIDVLIRNTTWTFTRDTEKGLEFTGVNFYDGQGFIAWKEADKNNIKDYPPNTKICMIKNTTSLKNFKNYVKKNKLNFEILEFLSTEAAEKNFLSRLCRIYSSDRSILASFKNSSYNLSASLKILDNSISKEPLGPVIRDNDSQWREIVQWTLYAMIEAEERGLNSQNVDSIRKSTVDSYDQYFLGVTEGIGRAVGLDDQWVYRIIKDVGNYSEVFERNIGPLGLDRGLNNLWSKGGLLYSPPFY